MEILILADSQRKQEFIQKFQSTSVKVDYSANYLNSYENYEVIFDCLFDEEIEPLENIINTSNGIIFLNSIKTSLAEINQFIELPKDRVFGFNGLPTFIDKKVWEITSLGSESNTLNKLFEKLEFDYSICDDRVGMVSPRVISMIINEAYYTVMEGTAEKPDIDQAMKLGTNYPFGPFEWSNSIGIENVFELLEALHQETKDERYKISPLLRKEYLQTI